MIGLPFVKPCPFCGSTEVGECVKETENYKNGKPVCIVFIKCYLCDANTKAYAYAADDEAGFWGAWENAVNAWERRVSNG